MALGDRGFRIDGGYRRRCVRRRQDMNGDGQADVLMERASDNGRQGSGSVYVVFGAGSGANVDPRRSLTRGSGSTEPRRLTSPGDRSPLPTGTGTATLGQTSLPGAAGGDNNGRQDSGSAYVVYLTGWGPSLDLGALGDRGFRIDGAGANDSVGGHVAGAGDFNGDERPDVLVGARGDAGGGAYILYGFGTSELAS